MGFLDSITGGLGSILGGGGGAAIGSLFGPAGTVLGTSLGSSLGGLFGGALDSQNKPDPFMGLNPAMLAATGQASSLANLAGLSGMGYGAEQGYQKEDMLNQMRRQLLANTFKDLFVKPPGTDTASQGNVSQTPNPYIRNALMAAMPNMQWASTLK